MVEFRVSIIAGRVRDRDAKITIMKLCENMDEFLVIEGETSAAKRPHPSLLKAVARGHRWFGELASGRAASIREIAKRAGVYDSYVKRVIPLAFLAPEIVRSICCGSHPSTLTAEALKHTVPLPLEWTKQRQILRCG